MKPEAPEAWLCLLRFAVARLEKLFEELKAAGERYGEDILQERAAPFHLRLERVLFRLFGGNHRADIFHEVDSAFFAFHTGTLFVAAGRAVETHRHMAALAEACDFAHGRAAFGAGNCCVGNWRCCGIPRVRSNYFILASTGRACGGLRSGVSS